MPHKDPEARKAYYRQWHRDNAEHKRLYKQRNRVKIKAQKKAAARADRAQNPEKYYRRNRSWRLKHLFGLTVDQWDALFESQHRCCALCRAEHHGGLNWCTDHDHETGVVRGILCLHCNVLLGRLGDTPEQILQNATRLIEYAKRCRQ